MAHIMLSEKAGKEPFEGIERAPQEFWDLYEESDLSVTPATTRLKTDPPPRHGYPMPLFRVADQHAV